MLSAPKFAFFSFTILNLKYKNLLYRGKIGHIDHLSPFLKDHPLPDGKTTPQVNILF
jgi:hypothetical protein